MPPVIAAHARGRTFVAGRRFGPDAGQFPVFVEPKPKRSVVIRISVLGDIAPFVLLAIPDDGRFAETCSPLARQRNVAKVWLRRCRERALGDIVRGGGVLAHVRARASFGKHGGNIFRRLVAAVDCGGAKQFKRAHIVLRHAFPVAIHFAQIVLRTRKILIRRALKPLGRGGEILTHAQTVVIEDPQSILRRRVPGFSHRPEVAKRGTIILIVERIDACLIRVRPPIGVAGQVFVGAVEQDIHSPARALQPEGFLALWRGKGNMPPGLNGLHRRFIISDQEIKSGRRRYRRLDLTKQMFVDHNT